MLSENEEKIRKELSKLMKHFQCPICLNLISDPMVTRCVHHFCGQCINKAIESSSSDYCRCPLCNEKITKRGLRSQLDVSDMIQTFKAAVDSFENDNQMSLITDNNDVVVFDVSSERSKSCVQSIDSFDGINETNDLNKTEDISLNQTKESAIEISDIESTRKTITSPSDMWPSCEALNESNNMKVTDETIPYNELTKSSTNESCDQSIDSVVEPNPTQSQLKLNKSRFTYSSSRPSTDDKFDRIMRLSEINSDINRGQPKNRPQEVECLQNDGKTFRRKPLIQLNKNQNLGQKKKFKRIQTLDSSDEEFNPIQTKSKGNEKKKSFKSYADKNDRKNGKQIFISDDETSDDFFVPAIHNKDLPIETNRSNVSLREESSKGLNSDVQLITSSPFSDF